MIRLLLALALALSAAVGTTSAATRSKSKAASSKKGSAPAVTVAKAVPVPSAAGKPNVLLILVDDLNDWVGWLGGHPQTRTPNIDRLAKQGLRFSNAHTAYALCNPSRTALLSGLAPWTSGVTGNEQDWRRSVQIIGKPTLPVFFQSMGFTTAAAGKVFHANHGGPEGRLTGWHGGRRGFEQDGAWDQRFPAPGVQLADLPVHIGRNFNGLDIWHWDWAGIDKPDEATEDGQAMAWAADYLSKATAKPKKPFFLTVGLYRPHSPWYVPKAYLDAFPLASIQLPQTKADDLSDVPAIARSHVATPGNLHELIVKKDAWKAAVQHYLASIAFADAQVGKLVAALEKSPAAKSTIIALTSDHGWYLGEKQMWHKGKLWERATHVPLSIVAPGITQPDSVCTQPVSLLDVYPTLAELTALALPPHLDGKSLVPQLRDPSTARATPAITAHASGGDKLSYSARTATHRYIRYHDGSEELYDHGTDPNEWTNLAAKPDTAGLRATLAKSLPTAVNSASRSLAQIAPATGPDAAQVFVFQVGDTLPAKDAPAITGHGFAYDITFDYAPDIDRDSTLISHGEGNVWYAIHLVNGSPTFTYTVDGKPTSLTLPALEPGFVQLRAMVPGNGIIHFAAEGRHAIAAATPFPTSWPTAPSGALAVGDSFGPLSAKAYPNSTPFDGVVHRLMLTVLPQ